jgi:hypothetical protein
MSAADGFVIREGRLYRLAYPEYAELVPVVYGPRRAPLPTYEEARRVGPFGR